MAALSNRGSIALDSGVRRRTWMQLPPPLMAPRDVVGRDHEVELLDQRQPPDRSLVVADARVGLGGCQHQIHGLYMLFLPGVRVSGGIGVNQLLELLIAKSGRYVRSEVLTGQLRREATRERGRPPAIPARPPARGVRKNSGVPPVISAARNTGWNGSIGTWAPACAAIDRAATSACCAASPPCLIGNHVASPAAQTASSPSTCMAVSVCTNPFCR